jgi:hypothetical protein
MIQASKDLSVAELFAEREERRRRDQETAERFQRRKEEELAAFKQRLEDVHLVDEMIPAQLARIKNAFERGESELRPRSPATSALMAAARWLILESGQSISRPRKKRPGRQSSPTGC